MVGEAVGLRVGLFVGCLVGVRVGLSVGDFVSVDIEGSCVGKLDGIEVGLPAIRK